MSEEKKTKKKGSWFSKVFYDSEESTETNESIEETQDDISVSNSGDVAPIIPTASMGIPATGDGVFDQRFNDSFQELIAANNIPGIDYFEFRQAVAQMSGVAGLNETSTLQIAYTNLKVGDPTLTKEKLMNSVDHYVGVLSEEESEFNEELASQTGSEVDSKRNRAIELNAENEDLVAQINEINAKIRENQAKAIELNNEASHAEANISQTSKNFIKTLTHVKSKLDTDKQKISDLIQE